MMKLDELFDKLGVNPSQLDLSFDSLIEEEDFLVWLDVELWYFGVLEYGML